MFDDKFCSDTLRTLPCCGGESDCGSGFPQSRGGATATKEAVGRLRHEDGVGGVRAVKRKNESGGLIFRRWNKRPGDAVSASAVDSPHRRSLLSTMHSMGHTEDQTTNHLLENAVEISQLVFK
jgi:hypothetical protein